MLFTDCTIDSFPILKITRAQVAIGDVRARASILTRLRLAVINWLYNYTDSFSKEGL